MAVGESGGLGERGVEWFKESFFDSEAILKKMDRATRRVFSRFGAFVRRRAQTSIRYRNQAAQPGQPPSAHKTGMKRRTNKKTGVTRSQPSSPLRDLIFFAYDAEKQSVVIGPALYPGASPGRMAPVRGTVPEVLEVGGMIRGQAQTPAIGQAAGRTRRQVHPRGNLRVEGRPFMAPALAAELPGLVPMYDHSF